MKSRVEEIAAAFGIKVDDLYRDTMMRKVTECRQVAMFALKYEYGLTYRQIGPIFNRCHAIAFRAIVRVNNLAETDKKYREILETLNLTQWLTINSST